MERRKYSQILSCVFYPSLVLVPGFISWSSAPGSRSIKMGLKSQNNYCFSAQGEKCMCLAGEAGYDSLMSDYFVPSGVITITSN
jgi:hypothetical protein